MATSDKIVQNPIVNILTKAQYQGITSPSADEFYLITDDASVSAGTGISVNSAGGETIVSLDSSYGLTTSDITTGTDTTNKLVSAKTIADAIAEGGGGGTITDVQINGTTIVSSTVANFLTNTAYNSSSNKIATMSDTVTNSYSADAPSGTNRILLYTSSSSTSTVTSTRTSGGLSFDSGTLQVGYAHSDEGSKGSLKLSNSASSNQNYTTINPSATAGISLALPSSSGTLALTSDIPADTKVTNTLGTTTKYYVTGTTSSTTTTGTQYFDTGIYATTTAGQLNATTYKVNENVTLQWNSSDASLDFIF